ncbi:F-box domain-containing protein [Strongyloides ratti]|uniref:F-box domain-containing protein n=1 Tax=Strongyloides ratti TaxID=34506 RepID=A0A090L9I3_STRRB|nr:F-box domain-containing protein [Strongyloides ratti]CEF64778.1 F-box domain-containing protein [Strongyloides ratti]
MVHDENIFEFPIMLLPNEVIKLILKNVDWKTIYNIRLASKFFNSFVKTNLVSFPKPKMKILNISSFYNTNDTLKIYFSFFCEDKFINLDSFSISANSNEVEDIEYYLQKMNLSDIEYAWIKTTGKTIIFDILNRYFKSGTSVKSLYIEINNNPVFESFSIFIQKMKYINLLYLTNLCFSNYKIPKNYTLPMIGNLCNLFILECQCTHFVNSNMINNLFLKNDNLKEIKIYSKCNNFEIELLKNIKNRQDLCNGQEDNHKQYHIYLPKRSGIINNIEFEKYFPCRTYHMLDAIENFCHFGAIKHCRKCSTPKAVYFRYITPPKPIGIICELNK